MAEKNAIKKASKEQPSQEVAMKSFAVSFFDLFKVSKITTTFFDLFKVSKNTKKQPSKEQSFQIDITSTLY